MKNDRYYYRRWVVSLALIVLFFLGCEPDSDTIAKNTSSGADGKAVTGNVKSPSVVELACQKIEAGDFEGAASVLKNASDSDSKEIEQVSQLIGEYEQLQSKRLELKKQTYEKELAEFEKLRDEVGGKEIVDANDIGEVFAAVMKVTEYADEKQKKKLLEDKFVKGIIEESLAKAEKFETDGKWVDAYGICYYWLKNLYRENTEYKTHAEKLTEMATIEIMLQDDSCGDTSEERHEGVKAEMFLRALKALEFNYVSIIDYGEMAKAALKRCRMLGEVATKSASAKEIPYKIAYRAEPEQEVKWRAGLDAIEESLSSGLVAVTKDRFERIFDEVLALNLVSLKLPEEVVVYQFTEASLSSLDPFTTLVWPKQVEDFEKSMTQQFSGIGVEISKATGVLKVVSLLPNTPAYASGLDAEDEILAVNGESTEEMTIFCAVDKITGPKGTDVTLTVRHPGSEKTEDITITRGKIVVEPLRGWKRDTKGKWRTFIDEENKIGYIRMTSFTENTVPDMEEALKELEAKGMRGLIIDLRANSGGYLVSAAGIVDMFVEEGLIVKSQPRWGVASYEVASKKGTHPNYPLVVMINEQSASASEIVAGALQDPKYRRATIVGDRSYGKGSVQVVVPYTGGGSQLKYTMAYYHLPSGQQVKNRYIMERQNSTDWGIKPEVEVDLRLNELRKMIEVQRANDVLSKHTNGDDSDNYQLSDVIKSDPQLSVALLVMKAKILRAGGSIEGLADKAVAAGQESKDK